jgi:hypothetical protein
MADERLQVKYHKDQRRPPEAKPLEYRRIPEMLSKRFPGRHCGTLSGGSLAAFFPGRKEVKETLAIFMDSASFEREAFTECRL